MSTENECSAGACPQPGQFGWNELLSADPAGSANFYEKLFGWEAVPHSPKGAPIGAPPYTLFKVGERMIAGMVKPSMDTPTQWLPYVVVADVDQSVAQALELNAEVILPVTDIGEVGRIAVVKDPQGAVIGLHELPR